MVSKKRKGELYFLWLNEDVIDELEEDWRDGLSEDELSLVNFWDMKYNSGVYQLCLDILQSER